MLRAGPLDRPPLPLRQPPSSPTAITISGFATNSLPSFRRALVADPVARAGAETPRAVPGVREPASVEREAAAADAGGQARPQPLELGDVFIDPPAPARGQLRPVRPFGHAVRGELGEFRTHLVQRHADPLGEDDKRDPPQDIPRVLPVPRSGPLGPDEAALLVETQGGSGHAAAAGHLGDGEQLGHTRNSSTTPLYFKFT